MSAELTPMHLLLQVFQLTPSRPYLRRVRVNHPKVWASLRVLRKRQLGIRHKGAIGKAQEHTQNWVNQRIGYRMSMRMMYGHEPLDVYAYIHKGILRYYKKILP